MTRVIGMFAAAGLFLAPAAFAIDLGGIQKDANKAAAKVPQKDKDKAKAQGKKTGDSVKADLTNTDGTPSDNVKKAAGDVDKTAADTKANVTGAKDSAGDTKTPPPAGK